MTILYPIGYQRRYGTIEEVKTFARWDLIEPEYGDRVEAWLISRQGSIGIGSSVRFVQPNADGFAPPGMSFHERQLMGDKTVYFMAIDLVCPNGDGRHRAPQWAEVPQQGTKHPDIKTYGLHCNVNGEPWHMQAVEVDGFVSWHNRGRPRPNPDFVLPAPVDPDPVPPPVDPVPPPVDPVPPPVDPVPPPTTGAITVQFTSRDLILGCTGNDVKWLQNNLNRIAGQGLTVDGQFGNGTKNAVMNWQQFFGLKVDGEAGAKTQQSIVEVGLQTGN